MARLSEEKEEDYKLWPVNNSDRSFMISNIAKWLTLPNVIRLCQTKSQ